MRLELLTIIFITASLSITTAAISISGNAESTNKLINLGKKVLNGSTTNNYYNISGGNISGDGTATYVCGFKAQNTIERIYPLRYTATNLTMCSDGDSIGVNLFSIRNDGCGNTVETWDNYGNRDISGSIIPKFSLSQEKKLGNSTHPFNETHTNKLYVTDKINDTSWNYAVGYLTERLTIKQSNDDGRLLLNVLGDNGAIVALNVSNAGEVAVGSNLRVGTNVYADGYYANGLEGMTVNLSVGPCWQYFRGGILTSTNCTIIA